MKRLVATLSCIMLVVGSSAPTMAGSKSVELTNDYINALGVTELAEGAIWEHDVSESENVKSVYSNYQHTEKDHSASCSLEGTNKKESGRQPAGTKAYSSTSGPKKLTALANYNTY